MHLSTGEVVMNRGTCFPGHLMQSSIRILFVGQLHEMVKKGAYENMDQIGESYATFTRMDIFNFI